MKHVFWLFFLITNLAQATSLFELFQYPEERNYTNADRGWMQYYARSIYHTNTFSLTFDDGPDLIKTPQILDILKRHEVKATFFVLTSKVNAQTYPLIKRMLDEGHIVGSHGPDHKRSVDQTEIQWKADLKRSIKELASWHKLAGHDFTNIFYRFPYGAYGNRADYHHMNTMRNLSKELMGDNCIQFAFWDVDTADWVPGMTAEEVSQNIIDHNQGGQIVDFEAVKGPDGKLTYRKKIYTLKEHPGGGIVLQHDVQEPSIKATDLFITYAKARGIKLVRLDEVEEYKVLRNCQLL